MQCTHIKPNGVRCKGTATGQNSLCWAHDPANAQTRQQIAAKGGKGKGARRVAALWDEVRAVIEGVEKKRLTPGQGNTMIRGYNTLIELVKLDISQGELEIQQRRLDLDVEERTELKQQVEELLELAERKRA